MSLYWAGTPNFTPGTYGVSYLFPHWTCGGFDGSVSTLQDPSRQASAHYVIEGDRVAQLVDEGDSAWHCGNGWYNMRSISYELVGWPGNPPSRATLDTCAQMMADASARYFGGAELVLGENVMLHKYVKSTSCPGETDIDYLICKANDILRGAAVPENHDDSEETMQAIIRPNGEDFLCYYDGGRMVKLSHPDEVTALNMAYNACHGRDIPMFELGTADAPWASRLASTCDSSESGVAPF